jgi:hypothetical protein
VITDKNKTIKEKNKVLRDPRGKRVFDPKINSGDFWSKN